MTLHTQDLNELDHFRNLSSHWWEPQGPFAQLHAITPLRVAFLKENTGIQFRFPEETHKPFQGLRVLDVGCGGGLLCEPLARLGADVTGIDPVQENIASAKAHAEKMDLSITYICCGLEDLPQNLTSFDVVIASEIVEHVMDYKGFLKACTSHLAPHGGMFVTTLNRTLKSYLFGILAAEYVLKWAPRGTHSWSKFVPPQELSQILSGLGLNKQSISGLSFSPFRGKWGLSCSTEINYFLWATREKP